MKRSKLQTLNWEIWTGSVIQIFVFGTALLYSIIVSEPVRVQSDNFCMPGLTQKSVMAQTYTRSSHQIKTGDEWGNDLAEQQASELSQPETCSRTYLFGSDGVGNDIFDLVVRGAPRYLVPAIIVGLVAVALGALFGVLEGYYKADSVSMRQFFSFKGFSSILAWLMSNSLSVYPPLVLLIFIMRLGSGDSLIIAGLVFGVIEATRLGNSIVNKIKFLKDQDFIASAKEMGLSDWKIISKHILWYNCRELLLIHLVFSVSSFIMMEMYLGYLNVGNFKAWGAIIGPAAREFHQYPLQLLLPMAVVILTVLGFYLVGDGLTKLMNRQTELNQFA